MGQKNFQGGILMQITYCDLQGSVSKLELSGAGGIIGYEKGNFITLDEVGISALHMRLTSSENRLFAEDLQKSFNPVPAGSFFSSIKPSGCLQKQTPLMFRVPVAGKICK